MSDPFPSDIEFLKKGLGLKFTLWSRLWTTLKIGNFGRKSVKAIFAVSRAELKRFRTIDGDTVGQIAAEFNHLNIIQHLHEIEPTLLQERNDQGKFWLA